MLRARRSYTILILATAVALAGCFPETQAVPTTSPSSPTATPSATAEALPEPTTLPAMDPGPCGREVPQMPAEEGAIEQLGGWELIVPLDQGPLPYAKGTATLDNNSVPVAYTVAANDNFESIAARFCIDPMYLDIINSVRRIPEFPSPQTVYVGDTVNLDAHTIYSVGDQNGVVHTNPFPDMATPPQR